MSHPLFDVARRQLSIAHHNGERARRFALDPPKARWYAVYRSARLATRGLVAHQERALTLAFRTYHIRGDCS